MLNPPDFTSLSYNDLRDAVYGRGAEKICPEYVANLVHQIRYGNLNSDNKTLAIYLLGDITPSDTNSIDILIENIDFKANRIEPPAHISRWGRYPAEEALMRIGKPAIVPILGDLPGENTELRRSLLCKVLNVVLRKYLAAKGSDQ